MVHRGDVLAVLDSSEYEELLRQQQITVERSRADHRQAELEYQIALLAVQEFREGTMAEATKDFERSVALAESDLLPLRGPAGLGSENEEEGLRSRRPGHQRRIQPCAG